MSEADADEITLAFELAALQRLVDPAAVITDTMYWTDHMGIVSNEQTHVVRKYARDWGFNPDFFPGPRSKRESLPGIKNQPEHSADRYILVSVDDDLQAFAEKYGWEFHPLEEAAETAGWTVATETDDNGEGDHSGWP
jgi:hypothetical protein